MAGDLHTHSTCSDGSVPIHRLPLMAARLGLSALALSDHDTILSAQYAYSITLVQTGARTMSAGLGIPMSIPYSCMPVGIVLMLLTSIEVLFKNISALRGAGKEAQV